MAKRVGMLIGGVVLVGAFLMWALFKGTEPVQSVIGSGSVLGFVLLGAAWLCLLGGVALIAKAIPWRNRAEESAVE